QLGPVVLQADRLWRARRCPRAGCRRTGRDRRLLRRPHEHELPDGWHRLDQPGALLRGHPADPGLEERWLPRHRPDPAAAPRHTVEAAEDGRDSLPDRPAYPGLISHALTFACYPS